MSITIPTYLGLRNGKGAALLNASSATLQIGDTAWTALDSSFTGKRWHGTAQHRAKRRALLQVPNIRRYRCSVKRVSLRLHRAGSQKQHCNS